MGSAKLTTYTQICDKLRRYSEALLKFYKPIQKSFKNPKDPTETVSNVRPGVIGIYFDILLQTSKNKDEMRNTLIDVPEKPLDLEKIFAKSYMKSAENLSNGSSDEICLNSDKNIQYEGIINMMLLILVANKNKNYYENALKAPEVQTDKNKIELCKKNCEGALITKDEMISSVLAAIWILENTEKEYKDYFSYGEICDEKGDPAIVFDIPYMGQMCVHYGHKINRDKIISTAKRKIESVLERRKELEQINQLGNSKNEIEKKFEKLKDELKKTKPFPAKYTSRLYEYNSSIPLPYRGKAIETKIKELGISEDYREITESDIKKIINSRLNPRECHYLGVKLGFSKKLLSIMHKKLQEKSIMSKGLLKETRDEYTKILHNDDVRGAGTMLHKKIKSRQRGKNER